MLKDNQKYKKISTSAEHEVGIKEDGTVVAVGNNRYGQCNLSDWDNIISVSLGYEHSVGLKSDGTVIAAGNNIRGQCNVSDWVDIISISTGDSYTIGLKSDGTVVAVGDNRKGQCNVLDWQNIVSVVASSESTMGVKADGTIVQVGDVEEIYNYGWKNIMSLSVMGSGNVVGRKTDNTLIIAGHNQESYNRELAKIKDLVSLTRTDEGTLVGLRDDGTLLIIGEDEGCFDIYDWQDIIAISSGESHIIGLKSDGTVVAEGDNSRGQCDVFEWNNISAIPSEFLWYKSIGLQSDGKIVQTKERVKTNSQNSRREELKKIKSQYDPYNRSKSKAGPIFAKFLAVILALIAAVIVVSPIYMERGPKADLMDIIIPMFFMGLLYSSPFILLFIFDGDAERLRIFFFLVALSINGYLFYINFPPFNFKLVLAIVFNITACILLMLYPRED